MHIAISVALSVAGAAVFLIAFRFLLKSLWGELDNSAVGFARRGEGFSHIEALSDVVFGFALTLLVVSPDVPLTFDELLASMQGLVAFAFCFAVLVLIWSQHHLFFRRFGLNDADTVFLTCLLLFVVVFYVYPLKFLANVAVILVSGRPELSAAGAVKYRISYAQGPYLVVIFGAGFAAVQAIIALLYAHAYRLRHQLQLTELERLHTRAEVIGNLALSTTGAISVVAALLIPANRASLALLPYVLTVPEITLSAWLARKRSMTLGRDAAATR